MKKHGYSSSKSKICLFFGDIVNFYSKHLKTDRAFIHEGFAAGVASGDLLLACYHCNHLITNMLAAGDPLGEVWKESQGRLEFVRQAKDPNIEKIVLSQQRFILNLLGKTSSSASFSDGRFDEGEFEGRIRNGEMTLVKFWYYILKMSACFIRGDIARAAEAEQAAREFCESDRFDMESTQFFFFSSLVLAAHYESAAAERKLEYLQLLRARLGQLKAWAESCPENFGNRFLLVSAELARLEGRFAEAAKLYELAIQSADENGFVQNAAIACERAFLFCKANGLFTAADAYLKKALGHYLRWGASGKVAELRKELSRGGSKQEIGRDPDALAAGSFSGQVDLSAVTKAQRAISSNLVPESLHKMFLKIALENSGAQRGAFVLFRDDSLTVEAEFDGKEVIVGSVPIDCAKSVPQSVIQYVSRVRSRVLLDDAGLPNPFSSDEYLLRSRPKSVLCMPVIRQNELMAILYLENSLTTHSFTDESMAVLEMLASQAAISIENAYLYDDLRKSVRARDEFIAIASHELKSPLNSVSLYVQTLKLIVQRKKISEYPEAKLLSILDISNSSIKTLAGLVDQLLDVSRMTLGAFKISLESVDLSEVVRDAIGRFQKQLASAGCACELDLAPGIVGDWDRWRLEQVVNNLISNAIKYASGKPIVIRTFLLEGRAVLSVEDRGIGISPQDRKKLFRPFERAVPYRSISGFGLGLYIIKKIVEAHEGKIELESEPGRGTTFRIDLPLNPSQPKEKRDAA
jgi:signal transduction histidine kinase